MEAGQPERDVKVRVAEPSVVPIDDDRATVAEAQVVAADVEMDERVAGKGSSRCRIRQGAQGRVKPGRRAQAQGEERRRFCGDALPVGARIERAVDEVLGWPGLAYRGEGIEDGRDPPIGPGRRPVRGGEVLEREGRPLTVVVEAANLREEPAEQGGVVAPLGAEPVGRDVGRADLHEGRSDAGARAVTVGHDPAGSGPGGGATDRRRAELTRPPAERALHPVDVAGRRHDAVGRIGHRVNASRLLRPARRAFR